MTRILLDAELRSKLRNLNEPLELCDESGQVVARVLPGRDPLDLDSSEPRISAAEIERRKQSTEPRYTTAQVLAHLRSL